MTITNVSHSNHTRSKKTSAKPLPKSYKNMKIEGEMVEYKVQKGDSIWKLAHGYLNANGKSVTDSDIMKLTMQIAGSNKDKIKNPNLIFAGQTIFLPKAKSAEVEKKVDESKDDTKDKTKDKTEQINDDNAKPLSTDITDEKVPEKNNDGGENKTERTEDKFSEILEYIDAQNENTNSFTKNDEKNRESKMEEAGVNMHGGMCLFDGSIIESSIPSYGSQDASSDA